VESVALLDIHCFILDAKSQHKVITLLEVRFLLPHIIPNTLGLIATGTKDAVSQLDIWLRIVYARTKHVPARPNSFEIRGVNVERKEM